MIPHADPGKRFELFQRQFNEANAALIKNGVFILGQEVNKFEQAFANYIGTAYAVAVNSGTDALVLSLMALDIGPGDEVISTSITAPATIAAIIRVGAVPVIVDITEPTHCLSSEAVERAVTSKTKAIIPVHLHGFSAPLVELDTIAKKFDLFLIEDCAQAHGVICNNKKLGSWGVCGAFSFYPTKNLGCIGDGGAITTNDPLIAERLLSLRCYGIEADGWIRTVGINSRMDELQAAYLNILLPHLEDYNKKRWYFAQQYHQALQAFDCVLPPMIPHTVYHQYVIKVKNRDKLRNDLLNQQIKTGIHYPYTMKDHPAFARYCTDIPMATAVVGQFLSLPIQPEILDVHFDQILDKITACLRKI